MSKDRKTENPVELSSTSNLETSGKNRSTDDGNTFKLSKKILRIEYPGLVKNIDKAIDTLGGINRIEMVASNLNSLGLHFHPDNKYNKPCVADKDMDPGILLHIKTTLDSHNKTVIDYDVIGVTTINYKFNRLCDFQYLPIISEKNDRESEGEIIYDKICPKHLPNLDWFVSKEISSQSRFYVPQIFSRFDTSNNMLYLNAGERFSLFYNMIKPDSLSMYENKSSKKRYLSAKKLSVCLSIVDPNTRIPDKPPELIMTIIKRRGILDIYNKVKELFEERPVWTKAGIQYILQISFENAKVLLPAVAFYCTLGPWRTCWIKYGYNPLKEFGSRIYQTLDFRIRSSDGVSIKVLPKRPTIRYKMSAPGDFSFQEDRCFILRPHYVPPARQMFYQYCDLYIPEIEEMLQRLPKVVANTKFDPKNGWLPASFTEQCREIVNKYVFDTVQEEIRRDHLTSQQEQGEEFADSSNQEQTIEENEPVTYCSKMLSNIKKGIYKSVNILPLKETSKLLTNVGTSGIVDTVDLVEDVTQDGLEISDGVNEISETMSELSDNEFSEGSDLEMDLESAVEINELIENAKHDFQPFLR